MITADEVSIGMTVGTQPPVRQTNLSLRAARVLGFDVGWTIDHMLGFFPSAIWDRDFSWLAAPESSPHAFFDYQVLLGALAKRAGRLQLGVGVTEPIRRHPAVIAQAMMTLAHMTKVPPILGIGAGERENVEPYGLDFSSPVSRLEEALQVIRLCFDSDGPIDFEGDYFSLDRAMMQLRAPRGRVPRMWVAAHGPRMLRLTGQFGDGWYPTFTMTPQTYETSLQTIRRSAKEVGRDPHAIVPGWQCFVVLGRTESDARRLLTSRPVRFMALLAPDEAWQAHGLTHPMGPGFRGMVDFMPETYDRATLDAAIDAVPVDLLAASAVWGTTGEVERKLSEFVDAGLRHLVMQPISGLVSRRDGLYSIQATVRIARALKRRGLVGI